MLQLRPTFSESWYRVVTLKPRLRGTAQISRQYYRGERWYVVRDAASNQFHRLSDAAYRFVGLLDGSRTVGEAWDLVGGTLADDAPTQPEVIQILSQLYSANLVETDIPPDATVLLRRHKKQQQRKLQSRMMNVLFPRIPIWDCDQFLCRWMPLARRIFSKIGAIVWLIVVGTAIALLIPHWADLVTAAQDAVNLRQNPENAFYLWVVFVLIKFLHECGHAFSCRRFGGEVHEMGIMFLVFVPTPYVDASTAWAFPNKWARMFVGAAGMIVELFVASLCAFVWLATHDSNSFISHLAYNAMLIASVTTLMFNANPLLRYDGYYILSDYVEIPNLQMRSREYLLGLIKRHVFRIKPTQPLPPPGQRAFLGIYGLFSSIYRVMVGITIVLVVAWQVPVLGVLMAVGGVITWAVVPIVRLFKYLTVDPELHRKRGRAWAFSIAVAALVVFLVGYLPVSRSVTASGVVQPQQRQMLYAAWPGWVEKVVAHDGDKLTKGQVILVARDPELETQISKIKAQLEQTEEQEREWRISGDEAQFHNAEVILELTNKQLDNAMRKRDELTLRAGFDGQLVAPEIQDLQGQYMEKGAKIGKLENRDVLLVRANLSQNDAIFRWGGASTLQDAKTEIMLVGAPGLILHARDAAIVLPPQPNLVDPRVTTTASEEFAIDPKDPSGTKAQIPEFELVALLANHDGVYYPGQGAYVRITIGDEPLYKRWRDKIYQLIQMRSSSKWM